MNKNLYSNARARRKKRRAQRLTVVIVVFICIVAFIFGTIYYLAGKFLTVKEVIVCGSSMYTKEQIIEVAQIDTSGKDDMIFLSSDKIEDKLEKSLPYIDKAVLYRRFPDTVIIKVSPAKPYATMKTDSGNWLINESNKVLENLNSTDEYSYLQVEYTSDKEQKIGENFAFNDSVQRKLFNKIVEASKKCGLLDKLNRINAKDMYDLYMYYDNRIQISCGNYSDIEEKIKFAAAIIEKRNETDNGIVYVENPKQASFKLTRS